MSAAVISSAMPDWHIIAANTFEPYLQSTIIWVSPDVFLLDLLSTDKYA